MPLFPFNDKASGLDESESDKGRAVSPNKVDIA